MEILRWIHKHLGRFIHHSSGGGRLKAEEDRLVVEIKKGLTLYVFKPFPPYTVCIGDMQWNYRNLDEIKLSNKITTILLEWLKES